MHHIIIKKWFSNMSSYSAERCEDGSFVWSATCGRFHCWGTSNSLMEAETVAGQEAERLSMLLDGERWNVTEPAVKKGGAT